MKKIMLGVLLIGALAGGGYAVSQSAGGDVLLPVEPKIEFLDSGKITEKALDPEKPVAGKKIYEGGTHRLGDVVYIQGVGIRLEAVGTVRNALEIDGLEEQLYGLYELSVLNYNPTPYKLEAKEVVLEFKDEQGNLYLQSMDISGYDKWQRIKHAYQFGEIPPATERTGNLYVPIKGTATQDGAFKVTINDVPVTFTY